MACRSPHRQQCLRLLTDSAEVEIAAMETVRNKRSPATMPTANRRQVVLLSRLRAYRRRPSRTDSYPRGSRTRNVQVLKECSLYEYVSGPLSPPQRSRAPSQHSRNNCYATLNSHTRSGPFKMTMLNISSII